MLAFAPLLLAAQVMSEGDFTTIGGSNTTDSRKKDESIDCHGVPDPIYTERGEDIIRFSYDGDGGNYACIGGTKSDTDFTYHKTFEDDTMDYVRRIEMWGHGHYNAIKRFCIAYGDGELKCQGKASGNPDCTFDFQNIDRLIDMQLVRNSNSVVNGDMRLGGLYFHVDRNGQSVAFSCNEYHKNHFDAKDVKGKQIAGFFGSVRKDQISTFGVLGVVPKCKIIKQEIVDVKCKDQVVDGVCRGKWSEYGGDSNSFSMKSTCDACNLPAGDGNQAICEFTFSRSATHSVTTTSTDIDSISTESATTVSAGLGFEIEGLFSATGEISETISVAYSHTWESSKSITDSTTITIDNKCGTHIGPGTGTIAIGEASLGNMIADLIFTVETTTSCDDPENPAPTIETYEGEVVVEDVALTTGIASCSYDPLECDESVRCPQYEDCRECKADNDCEFTTIGCVAEADQGANDSLDCPVDYCAWGTEAAGICCAYGCTSCSSESGCDAESGCCQQPIRDSGVMCEIDSDAECIIPGGGGNRVIDPCAALNNKRKACKKSKDMPPGMVCKYKKSGMCVMNKAAMEPTPEDPAQFCLDAEKKKGCKQASKILKAKKLGKCDWNKKEKECQLKEA